MPKKPPAYCLFRPRNLACVWVAPNKRLYLGPYGSPESYAAYARVIQRLLAGDEVTAETVAAAVREPNTVAPLTVAELVHRRLRYTEGYYRRDGESTGEHELHELATRSMVEVYGDLPAAEFGPLCLEDVRERMIDAGLARSTINGRVRRIVAAFKWAVSKQLVPPATHQALTSVPGLRAGRTAAKETAPVQPVPDDVVEATVKQLPAVVADMVRFQQLTGARPGEVCALRPCDVDRSGDVWQYRPARHKTAHHGRERVVFIGPKAQAVLLKYLARDAEARCFRPCDSEAKRRAEAHASRSTPLSCGNRPGTNRKSSPLLSAGDAYTKDTYARAIVRAAKRAGVERWTPNRLRHSYATAVRRDHGLEAAQVLLGHSGAKVTEIYAERDYEKGAAVARLIG